MPNFNGDGRLDMTVADYGWDGGAVRVFLNDGAWPLQQPSVSVSDVTVTEGNTGAVSTGGRNEASMSYRTVDGTAKTSDNDYVAKTGTVTFAPGETTKAITIEVKGDSKTEANETFYRDLFGNCGNSLFTKNRGVGTILNDD